MHGLRTKSGQPAPETRIAVLTNPDDAAVRDTFGRFAAGGTNDADSTAKSSLMIDRARDAERMNDGVIVTDGGTRASWRRKRR
jgi:hypothetical protein